MKTLLIVYALAVASTASCLGAEQSNPTASGVPGMVSAQPDPVMEKKFDFDFQGGNVELFVEFLERASKIPVNVLIPPEHKGFDLPPLKLRGVTVPQLFAAITSASMKTEKRPARHSATRGGVSYQDVTTAYGFKHTDQRPHANSIWYFFVQNPPPDPDVAVAEQPICRFWQLEPYLAQYQVEDITTAIETGWKMLKTSPAPKLSFHKETKLLVAAGSQNDLSLVDSVLQELTTAKAEPKDTPAKTGQALREQPSKR